MKEQLKKVAKIESNKFYKELDTTMEEYDKDPINDFDRGRAVNDAEKKK